MNKFVSVALILCLLFACSFLLLRSPSVTAADALGPDNELVGSWYDLSEGELYHMYQFKKDGTYLFYDGYDVTFEGTYVYDAKNQIVSIDNTDFFCSVCDNGLLIDLITYPGQHDVRSFIRS